MRAEKQWTTARVRAIQEPAEQVRLFELEPAGGATPYPPGSHLDVELLIDGRPGLRSYSVVGAAPQDGAWRIAVRRVADSRGGSRLLWLLAPGATVRITRPRSHFELGFGRPEYVLVAGGIGITPLLGMAQVLSRTRHRLSLLYAGRKRREMPFLPELEALLVSHPRIADAAVIGIQDDEQQTEVPRGYVVRRKLEQDGFSKQPLSAQEIMDFVKRNAANYKQLRGGVVFVDEIPKGSSGKILRRALPVGAKDALRPKL